MALSVGLNLAIIGVLAGMVLVTLNNADTNVTGSSQEGAVTVTADVVGDSIIVTPPSAGALALGTPPSPGAESVPTVLPANVTPSAFRATEDEPDRACQVFKTQVEPKWCPIGDPNGTTTFMLLGDSKAQQWVDAIDLVGQSLGWKGTLGTKTACPFSDARQVFDGDPYQECDEYDENVMEVLRANPPDYIITSQRFQKGFLPGDLGDGTNESGIAGLVSRWREVQSWGTRIISIVDSPSPGSLAPVYECVATHPDDLTQCSYERRRGSDRSGAPTQLAAAKALGGVYTIDLTDHICPGDTCPPVIGGVLVNRTSTHLTRSFELTLAPILLREIEAIAES